MDIVITGGAGVGKTLAAEKLIAEHFGVKNIYNTTLHQLFKCDTILAGRVDILRETIRAARVEAVLFDGCIANETDLLIAIQATKEAREQMGRNLYAVYIVQDDSVLNVSYHPDNIKLTAHVENRFKEGTTAAKVGHCVCPKGYPCVNNCGASRTDRILADLWDAVAERVDEADSEQMVMELTELASAAGIGRAGETAGLHHLDSDGKIKMHEYLLTLLRKYE